MTQKQKKKKTHFPMRKYAVKVIFDISFSCGVDKRERKRECVCVCVCDMLANWVLCRRRFRTGDDRMTIFRGHNLMRFTHLQK